MFTRCSLFVVVALTALSLTATAAFAEVRTANLSDPSDAGPTISGTPNNPDIRYLTATYDSNGLISFRIDFYHPINALDMSQNYAMSAEFRVGKPSDLDPHSCTTLAQGSIIGQHHVFSNVTTFYDRATVVGFDGYLNFTRTVSTDQTSITFTASSPAIANRDYRCLTYTLLTRRVASVDLLASRYDEYCDCWFVTTMLDTVANSKSPYSPLVWFDGYEPVDPAELPRVRSKMKFRPYGGCRKIELWNWEVTPDRVRGVEHSYAGGRMVFDIRKRGYHRQKRLPVRDGSNPVWHNVPVGRYRLKAWYTGDRFRRKSNVVKRIFKVKGC